MNSRSRDHVEEKARVVVLTTPLPYSLQRRLETQWGPSTTPASQRKRRTPAWVSVTAFVLAIIIGLGLGTTYLLLLMPAWSTAFADASLFEVEEVDRESERPVLQLVQSILQSTGASVRAGAPNTVLSTSGLARAGAPSTVLSTSGLARAGAPSTVPAKAAAPLPTRTPTRQRVATPIAIPTRAPTRIVRILPTSPRPPPAAHVVPPPPPVALPRVWQMPSWTSVQEASVAPGQPYFRLVKAIYFDEESAGGRVNIFVAVLDESGRPLIGTPVKMEWGAGEFTTREVEEKFDFFLQPYGLNAVATHDMSGGSSFAPDRGERGGYRVAVQNAPSDVVSGMGLPLKHHVAYLFVFQRTVR